MENDVGHAVPRLKRERKVHVIRYPARREQDPAFSTYDAADVIVEAALPGTLDEGLARFCAEHHVVEE